MESIYVAGACWRGECLIFIIDKRLTLIWPKDRWLCTACVVVQSYISVWCGQGVGVEQPFACSTHKGGSAYAHKNEIGKRQSLPILTSALCCLCARIDRLEACQCGVEGVCSAMLQNPAILRTESQTHKCARGSHLLYYEHLTLILHRIRWAKRFISFSGGPGGSGESVSCTSWARCVGQLSRYSGSHFLSF